MIDALSNGRRLLEGVRVIEVGQVLAAPHCGLLLASMGAEVIKIEAPGRGDLSRANPFYFDNGISAYFLQQNGGKKSVSIDLKHPEGGALFEQLVRQSDVLVENLRPNALQSMGFGWPHWAEVQPQLIMCSISVFGQTGPDTGRPGYGSLAEVRAGIAEMTGDPDGPPMPTNVPIADSMAASHACAAICAALFARERSGRGEYIDISILDCAFEMHDWPVQQYLASGGKLKQTRRGLYDYALVPWGYFRQGSDWICIMAYNEGFWRKLATLIGSPALNEAKFGTLGKRQQHAAEVYQIISEWVARSDVPTILREMKQAGIPAEKVQTIEEVVRDPQILARNMIIDVDHPLLGKVKTTNTAIRFQHSGWGVPGVAPLLGQHNSQVLESILGVSPERVEDLTQAGILYQEPLVSELKRKTES